MYSDPYMSRAGASRLSGLPLRLPPKAYGMQLLRDPIDDCLFLRQLCERPTRGKPCPGASSRSDESSSSLAFLAPSGGTCVLLQTRDSTQSGT
ncbi:hypothetical protein OH77DRAFT_259902 [Trametes cingulata]|nr:hypothetical protein OH77DRAFT_259902 [Trametes cingulata]